jgi:caa(3)-type oxidase subunit IV
MSEQSHGAASHEGDHHVNYVRIWVWLVVLLAVSVAGPMFEIFWLTMVTAFGIACVKAYMVVTRFMHITSEPRYITYIVVTALVFMLLFFAAVAPDVMNAEGTLWLKPTWLSPIPE